MADKRSLLIFCIIWICGSHCKQRNKSQKPNVILIVADDLGWNDVSFHGSAQIPTPNIDRLAKEGIILNNYYVNPICTPSRGALLTGKYPIHTGLQQDVIYGVEPWGLGLEEKLLPQFLRHMGYKTHAIGKWHLGFFQSNYTPTYRGFDSHFGKWLGHGDYFDHAAQEWDDWALDIRHNMEPVKNLTGRYSTDIYSKRAEKIILDHNTSSPLFLYLAHQAVHSANTYDPLQTTVQYYNRFPHIKHNGRRLFAGMVAGLDESVGRAHRALQSRGMDSNTILIFTTDNGGPAAGFNYNHANNWPLRGVKDTLWEGGVRGSAFIWSPLLQSAGRVSTQMMHITDWLPTILSAAKHKGRLSELDGHNMWRALSEDTASPRTEILLNIDHERQIYALRSAQYKLVIGSTYEGKWDGWYPPEGQSTISDSLTVNCTPPVDPSVKTSCQPLTGAPCLFDIEKDPCEYENLADIMPRKLEELMKKLRWYNTTVVPPRNLPHDPAAKPQYHNYIWSPWKD
ncbi:arylsulfatase B-like [Paramacrobiotus metropolitanus]|uniref:arylsulfatase B-like n=1 Tax=Paramacrobiotus metropolitanus TaxID=2943436 RepID=UPI002445F82A|nr:arylsulfatase B-like [Paramacrobiotus metropolitanus]